MERFASEQDSETLMWTKHCQKVNEIMILFCLCNPYDLRLIL